MANQPYVLAKQIEADIRRIIAPTDRSELGSRPKLLLDRIQHDVTDMRLDIRDYEMAETRGVQAKYAREATKRLEALRGYLVEASQYNIFSAIEIAHLSVYVDSIIEQLV